MRVPVRALPALVVLVVAGTACTIQPDAAPRDVPPDARNLLAPDAADAGETTGDSRVYFVTPNDVGETRQLRSVQRDVELRPDPVLESLFTGPTQAELDSRLVTAIPTGTQLLSTRTVGDVLFVDVTEELTQVSGDALVSAVAQIVFTATGIDGVQAVRLRVNGEDQAWPKGDGQPREGPLRSYDFPGLVQSAQPAFPAVPSAG
jgi:spore germination protein GerM